MFAEASGTDEHGYGCEGRIARTGNALEACDKKLENAAHSFDAGNDSSGYERRTNIDRF